MFQHREIWWLVCNRCSGTTTSEFSSKEEAKNVLFKMNWTEDSFFTGGNVHYCPDCKLTPIPPNRELSREELVLAYEDIQRELRVELDTQWRQAHQMICGPLVHQSFANCRWPKSALLQEKA